MSGMMSYNEGVWNTPSESLGTWPRTTGLGNRSNEYSDFLGQMPQQKYNVKEDLPLQTPDITDAYIGRNLFLEGRTKGLFMTDKEWVTKVIPIMESSEKHFSWGHWKFHRTLASLVPNQGIPRLVTSSKAQRSANTLRRGLGMIIEGDFVRTPEGQREYSNKLTGIVSCILETMKDNTLFKLVTANDDVKEQRAQYGLSHVNMNKLYEFEINQYAAVNTGAPSFVMLSERYKRMLVNQGITPDILVVTPESMVVMSAIGPFMPQPIPYTIIGPDGQLFRADGPLSITRLPDGTNIVEMRDLIIEDNGPRFQPLMSSSTISEHYYMNWDDNMRRNLLTDGCGRFRSEHRDIMVYNAESDRNEMISFLDAFRHSKYFDTALLHRMIDENHYTHDDFTLGPHGQSRHHHHGPGGPGGGPGGGNTSAMTSGISMPLMGGPGGSTMGAVSSMGTLTPGLQDDATLGKRRRAPFTIFWNHETNRPEVAFYFGQLDQDVAPTTFTKQMAQTVLSGIEGFSENMLEFTQIFREGMSHMRALEAADYHQAFFEALLEENTPENTDPYTNQFKGSWLHEDAPDLAHRFRDIHEWLPIRLPVKTAAMDDVVYPPGFASSYGIRALIEAYDAGKGWDIGKKLKPFWDLLNLLYERVRIAFAYSEAVEPTNRSPWFHDANGIYTFIDNCVLRPTEPLFLAYLGVTGERREPHHEEGSEEEEGSEDEDLSASGSASEGEDGGDDGGNGKRSTNEFAFNPSHYSFNDILANNTLRVLERVKTVEGGDRMSSHEKQRAIKEEIKIKKDDLETFTAKISKFIRTLQNGDILKLYADGDEADDLKRSISISKPFINFGTDTIIPKGFAQIDTVLSMASYQPTPFIVAAAKLGQRSLPWLIQMGSNLFSEIFIEKIITDKTPPEEQTEESFEKMIRESIHEYYPTFSRILEIVNSHTAEDARAFIAGITSFKKTTIDNKKFSSNLKNLLDSNDPLSEQETIKKGRAVINGSERNSDPDFEGINPNVPVITRKTAQAFNKLFTDKIKNAEGQLPAGYIDNLSNQDLAQRIRNLRMLSQTVYSDLERIVLARRDDVSDELFRVFTTNGAYYAFPTAVLGEYQTDTIREKIARVVERSGKREIKELVTAYLENLPRQQPVDGGEEGEQREGQSDTTELRNDLAALQNEEASFTNFLAGNRLAGYPYTLLDPVTGNTFELGKRNSRGKMVSINTTTMARASWYRSSIVLTRGLRDYFRRTQHSAAPIRPAEYSTGYETPVIEMTDSFTEHQDSVFVDIDFMPRGADRVERRGEAERERRQDEEPGALERFRQLRGGPQRGAQREAQREEEEEEGEGDDLVRGGHTASRIGARHHRERRRRGHHSSTRGTGRGNANNVPSVFHEKYSESGSGAYKPGKLTTIEVSHDNYARTSAPIGARYGPHYSGPQPMQFGGTRDYHGHHPSDDLYGYSGHRSSSSSSSTGAVLVNGRTRSEHMRVGNFVYNVEKAHSFDNPLLTVVALAYFMSRCDTPEPWEQMISCDVLVPCNIIVFRPLIEHWMDSFLLMKSGPETGVNVIGNTNMMVGRSVNDKMLHANLTLWMNTIIIHPENVIVMRNVKTRQIIGGVDMRWIVSQQELNSPANSRGSLIPLLVPITEENFPNAMSISGAIQFPDTNPALDRPQINLYSTCNYYDHVWGFSKLIDYHFDQYHKFYQDGPRLPPVSFEGQKYAYNRAKGDWSKRTDCKGHRKPQGSVPGARAVWNAERPYFTDIKDIDYRTLAMA